MISNLAVAPALIRKPPASFDKPIHVTQPLLPPLEEYKERLAEIWEAKWLTNGGPQHAALEQRLSKFFDDSHVSLFNNGTIALVTACQAFRLQG